MTQIEKSPDLRARKWLLFAVVLLVFSLLAVWLWPYVSFLTDREALREIILGSGPWAPVVYMFLQMLQVIIAPIPGTVIGLAGGYVFETFLSTLYAMIGTTIGFFIVFVISKKFGRRIMRYFVSPESVAKYDDVATRKSAFAFIAIGFLFPFIPDPVLGYIAGTTPISTKVLMIICVVMRTPGVMMTSLIGSQVGQGNYTTVVILLILLAVALILGVIFYKQITDWTDKLYRLAMKEQVKSERRERKQIVAAQKRKRQRRRRNRALAKRVSRTVRGRRRTKRRK